MTKQCSFSVLVYFILFTYDAALLNCSSFTYFSCFVQAHKALTDLETSRDGLLYEQYKLESHNKADIKQLQLFFADAEGLSVCIWFVSCNRRWFVSNVSNENRFKRKFVNDLKITIHNSNNVQE